MTAQSCRPRQHVVRSTACESKQQYPLGRQPPFEKSGHARGQSAGLARCPRRQQSQGDRRHARLRRAAPRPDWQSQAASSYICSMLSLQTGPARERRLFGRCPPLPLNRYVSAQDRGRNGNVLKDAANLPITFLVASQDRYEDRASTRSIKVAIRTGRRRGPLSSRACERHHLAHAHTSAPQAQRKIGRSLVRGPPRRRRRRPAALGPDRVPRALPRPHIPAARGQSC